MIFNDMDAWRQALTKCHLNESSMPTSRGYLIENVECYNKIQCLLNTPEMEHCHKFLYNLDVEDLQEDEVQKVNELYDLGKERGVIVDDDAENSNESENYRQQKFCGWCGTKLKPSGEHPDILVCPKCGSKVDISEEAEDCDECDAADVSAQMPAQVPAQAVQPVKVCAFTVMYSAMKDGEIKTGESYSNAISPRAAKADILAKLSQLGYDNITILAIEAGDPDSVGQNDLTQNFVPPAQDVPTAEDERINEWGRYETGLEKGRMYKTYKPIDDGMADYYNTMDEEYKYKRDKKDILDLIKSFFKGKKVKNTNYDLIKEIQRLIVRWVKVTKPDYSKALKIGQDWIEDGGRTDKNKDISAELNQIYNILTGKENSIDDIIKDSELNEADKKTSDDKEDSKKEDKKEDKEEDKEDADKSDDEDADKTDDEDAEADDEDTDDAEADDDSDDEDAEADDADDEDGEDDELDDTKKNQLKDQYTKAFKAAMLKCQFEKSFNDLNIDEKVKLFTELNKTWKDKADPSKFMTPKETDSLNKTVMKR